MLQLKLLSLRRAAKSLGLSPITLKNAVANGDVPATQLNGRLRFEQSVLATWAFGTHRRAAKPERVPQLGPAKRNSPQATAQKDAHDQA